jgi:hypothetical protein
MHDIAHAEQICPNRLLEWIVRKSLVTVVELTEEEPLQNHSQVVKVASSKLHSSCTMYTPLCHIALYTHSALNIAPR